MHTRMTTRAAFMPGSLGHAAASYASRGIHIFPCWWTVDGTCQCGRGRRCHSPGKHPRTPHGVDDATADADQIIDWWRTWPRANIGLAAGANNLAIIDVDPGHGGNDTIRHLATWLDHTHGIDLYATRLIRTGSGGLHLYYHAPPSGIKTGARSFQPLEPQPGGPGLPGVDTRGEGGYVIAPPSTHATGGQYEPIHTGSRVAPWPWPLTARMQPATPPPTTGGTGFPPAREWLPPARPIGTARIETRLRAWAARGHELECATLRELPATKSGHAKNDALNKAAYRSGLKLDAGLLPSRRHVEEDLYLATADWSGHSRREIMATITSGLNAAQGQAGLKLHLPPWADGYTITRGGNR